MKVLRLFCNTCLCTMRTLRFFYVGLFSYSSLKPFHSLRIALQFFRLIKEFDREIKDEETRNPPEVNKQLNDEKQSLVSCV